MAREKEKPREKEEQKSGKENEREGGGELKNCPSCYRIAVPKLLNNIMMIMYNSHDV